MNILNLLRQSAAIGLMAAWILAAVPEVVGQPVTSPNKNSVASNLVRPEYYAGIDFLADGQTAQALSVFDTAYAQSRTVSDQKGIDCVPALVMMGECHLEQCDIGLAMEKYDAGLQISILGQRWISLLKNNASVPRPDTRVREIPWGTSKRGTQMGTYTEAWPIALAVPDLLLENTTAVANGKIVAIDALEILRCQAIALRRRFQLLGPLAKHSPLTNELVKAFPLQTNGRVDQIAYANNLCRGLALLSQGNRDEAIRLIKEHLSLGNGFDHPLTAVGMLALADLAIEANEISEAEERAFEAALCAARAGQMEHVAEAIALYANTGAAAGHDAAVAKTIPQVIAWAANRSRWVAIRSQVAWTRLNAFAGDVEAFRKNSTLATTMLLPKPVVLPRDESALRYAKARVEFLEGKVGDGINSLVESIAFLRSPTEGTGSARLFQLNLIESLVNAKALSPDVSEPLLSQLLAPAEPGHWKARPLEQLAWLFATKTSIMDLRNRMRLASKSDAEMVTAFDEATVLRYRQNGELESRVFDLMMSIHADTKQLTKNQAAAAQQMRSQFPTLVANASKISEQLQPMRTSPKWDLRKWSEEDIRRWDNIMRQSDIQESLGFAQAISAVSIPESFPPRHDPESFLASLQDSDAVLFFVFFDSQLRGYLFRDSKWTSWVVSDPELLQRQTVQYTKDLQTLRTLGTSQAEVNKVWTHRKRQELCSLLFPKEVWSRLASSKRWIVIPDRFLWYFPFESLPVADQPFALPCIVEHPMVMVPTLGLVPQMLSTPITELKRATDIHLGDFFSRNAFRAKELREEIASARNRTLCDLNAKGSSFPPTRYFKCVADGLFSFSPTSLDALAPTPTDRKPNLSSIHMWRKLPWGTPQLVALPAVNALPIPDPVTGDEWLKVLLPSIAQGTRLITISRWPVGGESTAFAMRSFAENCQDMPASGAWQRSLVSLWEERLDPKGEPALREPNNASATDDMITGAHPLLWSSYIQIGDTK